MAQTVLTVRSPAFRHEGAIPEKYTCDGEDINPPLEIRDIPEGTRSLVLIVDDPDAPAGTWDHWIVWNIPPQHSIAEDSIPGMEALNSYGWTHYSGPCPPSGRHHYHFKVYALDIVPDLPDNINKQAVENAMTGHVLAQGVIIGVYERKG